ncbi:hypothetical protein M378DRAFT_86082, partial [Amanita muscaria Koide BX008]
YPSFYTRLYAFLDREVLHLKRRARLFCMMELFLGSLVGTYLHFKRLSRLSLSTPPVAIVIIILFTYHILKRYLTLMVMIHRVKGRMMRLPVQEPKFAQRNHCLTSHPDPFLSQGPNPLLTHALSSSLWELYNQRSHYHSCEAFTKPGYICHGKSPRSYISLRDGMNVICELCLRCV